MANDSQNPNAKEVYNTVAETVGGVPSLRWKDNLIQGAVIAATVVAGVLVGFLITFNWTGAAVGAFVGLVGGLLISGVVLMVVGWMRAARNVKQWRAGSSQTAPPA